MLGRVDAKENSNTALKDGFSFSPATNAFFLCLCQSVLKYILSSASCESLAWCSHDLALVTALLGGFLESVHKAMRNVPEKYFIIRLFHDRLKALYPESLISSPSGNNINIY